MLSSNIKMIYLKIGIEFHEAKSFVLTSLSLQFLIFLDFSEYVWLTASVQMGFLTAEQLNELQTFLLFLIRSVRYVSHSFTQSFGFCN